MSREALQVILEQPQAMGLVALSEGKLMAFLIGCPAVNTLRGRHVWIHPAGIGVDPSCSLEILRDLYARLGAIWVRNGFFDHFVLTLAERDWLEPWLKLGFGFEQAHALLDLEKLDTASLSVNPRLIVRQAQQEDRGVVQSFSRIIPRAHAGAPVWGVALPEDVPEIYEGYGELLDEAGTTTWLAFMEEKPVGIQVYRTLPDQGTNLLSSRHWPGLGFSPVAYRLVRKVDPRIAWADGYNEWKTGAHHRGTF